MRLLIGYEDSHLVYGEVMESAIRSSRPHLETKAVRLSDLVAQVERFVPHMVLCERSNTVDPGGRGAWVKHSYEPNEPSEVCLDGRRWEVENPGLEELLEIIDEVEKLLQTGRSLGGLLAVFDAYSPNFLEYAFCELRP
jgi:hypothetical protein